jgi:ABC-type transport system involved in cytochrome bd biosynthesis fused ATPase/permease subunit
MLFYSHTWDGLLKLISLALLIVAAVHWDLDQRLHSVALMIGLLVVLWVVLYRQFISILSSWLYARISLHTKVTFTEAKTLRKLFQLDLSARWIPMKEIKNLPFDQRHDALLIALERIGSSRKAMLL